MRARALLEHEIIEIIGRFATTARVAREAGFDGVQLHAAHGYLISRFLSARSNRRDDDWGGDTERRRQFALSIVRATRDAVGPDFPIGIKLNSADFLRGGFSQEESADLIAVLADEGVDLIEISGGTYEAPAMLGQARQQRQSTREREAFFLEHAERVRARVPDTPLMVTGGFRSAAAMTEAITTGACDVVGVGRPLVWRPEGALGLIDGSRDRVEARERRLGVDKADSVIDMHWHTRQMQRLGAGREPRPGEPVALTLAAFVAENGWNSFRRRRGG